MKNSVRRVAAPLMALAFVASACIATSETSDLNGDDPQVDMSLVVDQGDTPSEDPLADGEPRDGATIPGPSGVLIGGGLTIPEALATDTTGVLAVQGFYLDDGTGPRLCEVLAESYPPQCGGASVSLGDVRDIDLGALQSTGNVTWSDDPVVILGELIDGVLVPSSTSI